MRACSCITRLLADSSVIMDQSTPGAGHECRYYVTTSLDQLKTLIVDTERTYLRYVQAIMEEQGGHGRQRATSRALFRAHKTFAAIRKDLGDRLYHFVRDSRHRGEARNIHDEPTIKLPLNYIAHDCAKVCALITAHWPVASSWPGERQSPLDGQQDEPAGSSGQASQQTSSSSSTTTWALDSTADDELGQTTTDSESELHIVQATSAGHDSSGPVDSQLQYTRPRQASHGGMAAEGGGGGEQDTSGASSPAVSSQNLCKYTAEASQAEWEVRSYMGAQRHDFYKHLDEAYGRRMARGSGAGVEEGQKAATGEVGSGGEVATGATKAAASGGSIREREEAGRRLERAGGAPGEAYKEAIGSIHKWSHKGGRTRFQTSWAPYNIIAWDTVEELVERDSQGLRRYLLELQRARPKAFASIVKRNAAQLGRLRLHEPDQVAQHTARHNTK